MIGPLGLPLSASASARAVALLLADLGAVELRVGREIRVEDQAVVADHRDVRLLGAGHHARGRGRIDRVEDDHVDALGHRGLDLRLLLGRVLVGVLVQDLAVRAELLDLLLEQRLVLGLVARRLRLGQQEADLAAAARAAVAAVESSSLPQAASPSASDQPGEPDQQPHPVPSLDSSGSSCSKTSFYVSFPLSRPRHAGSRHSDSRGLAQGTPGSRTGPTRASPARGPRAARRARRARRRRFRPRPRRSGSRCAAPPRAAGRAGPRRRRSGRRRRSRTRG